MLHLQCRGDAADQDHQGAGPGGGPVYESNMRADCSHVRAFPGLRKNEQVQGGTTQLNGLWLSQLESYYEMDETFYQLLDVLEVERQCTYVATGCGDVVKGTMPVVTFPIISPPDHYDSK